MFSAVNVKRTRNKKKEAEVFFNQKQHCRLNRLANFLRLSLSSGPGSVTHITYYVGTHLTWHGAGEAAHQKEVHLPDEAAVTGDEDAHPPALLRPQPDRCAPQLF
jgi:hypothetical protein